MFWIGIVIGLVIGLVLALAVEVIAGFGVDSDYL